MLVLAIALRALRWQYLFPARDRPGYRAVSTAFLIGYFFNSVLPARAGEAARVVAIGRLEPVSRMTAAGTVVVERVYDFLVVGLLLLILVPGLPRVTWLPQTLSFLGRSSSSSPESPIVLRTARRRPVRSLLAPLQKLAASSTAPRLDLAATNLTAAFTTARTPRPAALGSPSASLVAHCSVSRSGS